jgi:SAM-dependent methyltransferase
MVGTVNKVFSNPVVVNGNLIINKTISEFENQQQTNEAFSDKWLKNEIKITVDDVQAFQRNWYLQLYGFDTELVFAEFLKTKKVILDAGCGLGYKAAWMAELSPDSIVIGMDFSDAVLAAAKYYSGIKNLFFVKGDIANTGLFPETLDYISCDQVIHHTEFPEKTFEHLSRLLTSHGEFACYVYAKKALPRELLDEHFRNFTKQCTKEELWEMSEQLTVLGKTLSELNVNVVVPEIPLLGIKGGHYDIQRFIYWNFLKCFWNQQFTWENNVATNYDWYAPSNAQRYSEEEFKVWGKKNKLDIAFFHKEEACYSARFKNNN